MLPNITDLSVQIQANRSQSHSTSVCTALSVSPVHKLHSTILYNIYFWWLIVHYLCTYIPLFSQVSTYLGILDSLLSQPWHSSNYRLHSSPSNNVSKHGRCIPNGSGCVYTSDLHLGLLKPTRPGESPSRPRFFAFPADIFGKADWMSKVYLAA